MITERQYSWKYLNNYLDRYGLINVTAYSKVKKVVENSCIAWNEI